MDSFIQSASDLLEAYPGATVSITYSNVAKKTKKEDPKKATNVVKFKVHDLALNKSVSYSTYKSKELLRVLTYLGPKGVIMQSTALDEPAAKKQKLNVGAASVMSNTKIEEAEPTETVELEAVETPAPEEVPVASASSKKKKKKGKKK